MEKEESRFPENPKNWTEEEKVKFLEENRGLLYSFALPVYRVLSIKDASYGLEDCMQVAAIAFWRAMETYRPYQGCRFSTYAGYLIRRDLKDIRRKVYAEKRKKPEGAEQGQEGIKSGDPGEIPFSKKGGEETLANPVESEILRRNFYLEVMEALMTFDVKSRRIFWLLSQKLATQTELAEEYHCSQSKISLEYKQIRKALKRKLEEG